MEANDLYYALSTIAQCAAALAALIGFFGLWRLDRLRDEDTHLENELRGLVVHAANESPLLLTRARICVLCRQYINEPQSQPNGEMYKPQIEPRFNQWKALPGKRQQHMDALVYFLVGTLFILVLAIVGIIFVNKLKGWPLTPWLIGLASIGLGVGPAYVILQAAGGTHVLTRHWPHLMHQAQRTRSRVRTTIQAASQALRAAITHKGKR